MATTTKKRSTSKKAKPRSPNLKTSVTERAQTIAELRQQLAESLEWKKAALKDLQDRDQQLAESLQRENATGEVLGLIASSAQGLQRVLDTVAENAALLCEAKDALIFRIEGEFYRRVARYGSMPTRGVLRPRKISSNDR